MTARVMVFATITEGQEEAFEAAYAVVTARVKGTQGHLQDELLRHHGQPGRYVLLSEWESLDAFLSWEDAPVHREVTTPMRPYWTGRVERILFEVTAKVGAQATAPQIDNSTHQFHRSIS